MSPRMLALAPVGVFALVVVNARLSGNDKSPFLVLLVLAVLALLLLGALIGAFRGGPAASKAWALAVGAAVPLAYSALVVVLARWQLVDPLNWLGFR